MADMPDTDRGNAASADAGFDYPIDWTTDRSSHVLDLRQPLR
ncbi:MAG TPA: hypothetical protein VGC55_18620 [Dokdonella sp.]